MHEHYGWIYTNLTERTSGNIYLLHKIIRKNVNPQNFNDSMLGGLSHLFIEYHCNEEKQ